MGGRGIWAMATIRSCDGSEQASTGPGTPGAGPTNGDVDGPGWTNEAGPSCGDPNALATAVFPNCPGKLFQFHHQPFNYFAAFDPTTNGGRANREAHLRDETEFLQLAGASTRHECRLNPVSFAKPVGEENEHPGYTGEVQGSNHLVVLPFVVDHTLYDTTSILTTIERRFGLGPLGTRDGAVENLSAVFDRDGYED